MKFGKMKPHRRRRLFVVLFIVALVAGTTMMMSFLGVSFANVLVKLLFLDPTTTTPQTA